MKRLILVAVMMAAGLPAGAQRPLPATVDRYGYVPADSGSAAVCPYQFVDLALSGTALNLVAAGTAPAGDDGGAAVTLSLPFEFYGQPVNTLVASSNGYLAPGAGLDGEDGGHWRADCPLPAIPDNARARFGRIYALGGDLEAGTAGQLLLEHFADCPRPPASAQAEACTIVQWRNWNRLGQVDALDFQAVLYHSSWEIALQYRSLVATAPAERFTVGLQDDSASSGLALACADGMPVQPAQAVCLFDPRFAPPSEAIFADGFEVLAP